MPGPRFHFIAAAALVAACLARPALAAEGTRAEIDAANAQFSAAAAKGDGAGVAALYAVDGQVLPSGSDPIKGAQAIQKFWQGDATPESSANVPAAKKSP